MIQENIDLLKKDLSSRIPYGLKIKVEYNWYEEIRSSDVNMRGVNGYFVIYDSITGETEASITKVKPYLRPLLSMTEDEKNELLQCTGSTIDKVIDFYNSNHFDYRGLIPKGLALEATEEMYKNL